MPTVYKHGDIPRKMKEDIDCIKFGIERGIVVVKWKKSWIREDEFTKGEMLKEYKKKLLLNEQKILSLKSKKEESD